MLVAHDDVVLLDELTWLLESRDLEVHVAATTLSATGQIRANNYDLVVMPFDRPRMPGVDFYAKAVAFKPALRARFVFLHEGDPPSMAGAVDIHCPIVEPGEREELVRLIDGAIGRSQRMQAVDLARVDLDYLEQRKPRLLLVEDEPLQLMAMVRVLQDFGFDVTAADCGNAAIARLQDEEFHVVLSDWHMEDGHGGELYEWIDVHRPDLRHRVVFMSGDVPRDFAKRAPGRRLVPKGQDGGQLVDLLFQIVREG